MKHIVPRRQTIIRAAVFGGLWGALEITLGGPMQAAHIPFRGTVMTFLGIGLALVGFALTPSRGFVFLCGTTAALLRLLSPAGQPLFAMAAIVVEASLAEITLRAFTHRPSTVALVCAAVAAMLWDFAHPFAVQTLHAGVDLPLAYIRIVRKGAGMLGVSGFTVGAVVAALLMLRVVAGVLCGLVASGLSRAVAARLQAGIPTPDE